MDHKKDCKFSAANWKIIEELKEEKRKLEQFDVISHSPIPKEIENETQPQRLFSPSQYIGTSTNAASPIQVGSKIEVHKYCRQSICTMEDNPSRVESADFIPKEVSELSPGFTFEEKLLGQKLNTGYQEKQQEQYLQQTKQQKEGDRQQEMVVEETLPQPLSNILDCLMSVEHFKHFIYDLSVDLPKESKKIEKYPTIKFFVEAIDRHRYPLNRCNISEFSEMSISHDLSITLQEEPSSTLLLSVFEVMHEELVQAKQDGVINKICMQKCRYTSKENHTIISHLFRGHLKRKMICDCGSTKLSNEAFTTIDLPINLFEEKQIILYFAGGNEEQKFTVTKYLIMISSWSTVASLKEKLVLLCKRKDLMITTEVLSLHLVYKNHVKHAEKESQRIFNLMCQEGDIMLFDTSFGTLSINISSLIDQSGSTIYLLDGDDDMQTTSDVSEIEQNISRIQITKQQEKTHTALVYVNVLFARNNERYSLVLRLPRVSHGLHIMERISRIFHLQISDRQNMSISIKNKIGHCVFCLSPCCTGCVIQMSEKIVLSHQYTLTVLFNSDIPVKMVNIVDDSSVITYTPVKIISLQECFTSFTERTDASICSNCLNTQWHAAKSEIIKWPEVLILHLPTHVLQKYQLLFSPSTNFFQDSCKPIYGVYDLKSLISNDGDQCTYLKEIDSWYLSIGNEKQKVDGPPITFMEMMFFVKQKASSNAGISKRLKKQSRMKQKFSARTRQRKRKFSCSTAKETNSHNILNGQFTPRNCSPVALDQTSNCACNQCRTFDKVQEQMIQSRSNSVIQSRDNNVINKSRNHAYNETKKSSSSYSQKCCVERKSNHSFVSQKTDRSSVCSSQVSFIYERKLHKAIREQNLKDAVKSLRDGADVNHILHRSSALHLSVALLPPFGCVFTTLCIEHGGDPNLLSADGYTPVHQAVTLGREDTLKILLKNGGLPNIRNAAGKNAFDILLQSSIENSESMLRLLRGEHDEEEINSQACLTVKNKKPSSSNIDIEDEISLLNVSGDDMTMERCDILEMIGERTFDEAFNILPTTKFDENHTTSQSDSINTHLNISGLKESVVSEHFSDFENSRVSFNGSRRFSWFSRRLRKWFSRFFKRR